MKFEVYTGNINYLNTIVGMFILENDYKWLFDKQKDLSVYLFDSCSRIVSNDRFYGELSRKIDLNKEPVTVLFELSDNIKLAGHKLIFDKDQVTVGCKTFDKKGIENLFHFLETGEIPTLNNTFMKLETAPSYVIIEGEKITKELVSQILNRMRESK